MGTELDALVAEKVMGLDVEWNTETPCPYCDSEMRYCGDRSRCTQCGEWRYGPYKEYSTNMAAAWEVVEKLCNWDVGDNMLILMGQGPDPSNPDDPGNWWEAEINGIKIGKVKAKADTAPHAICLAALKAKEVDAVKELAAQG